ncbi:MAG: hypothetical protein U0694_00310 [Anaerolineae bacterium]
MPFQIENQQEWQCRTTGARHKFMNELPQEDGTSQYELSDSGYAEKLVKRGAADHTYYDDDGNFYHADYLKPPVKPSL